MATFKEIVHRSKILRKSLSKQVKALRKQVRKTSRKKSPLSLEEVHPQLQNFSLQLQEILNLEATRQRAEQEIRLDLVVDGTTIARQIPLGLLVHLNKELDLQQKLFKALRKADDSPALEEVYHRIQDLQKALDQALQTAGAHSLEESTLSHHLTDYLFAPLQPSSPD